jgi:hypothetical protein
MRTTRSNVPQNEPLKWNVEKGAAEFAVSIGTLRKALAKDSATPDTDGLYTTQQIAAAIYGALHFEKVRTQRELARKLELENSITTASVLNRHALEQGLAAIADAFVSRLMSANEMSRETKEDLLRELSSWPMVLDSVARNQTRFRRGNGQAPEDDAAQ